MAIARTQNVSANATTVTLSSTTAGDVILAWNYRTSGSAAPGLPSGYTSLATTANSGNSARISYKISGGGETSTPTSSNASQTVAHVYRGLDQTTPCTVNGNGIRVGASSTTMQLTAFGSMTDSGDSWIAGFVAAASATAGMNSNTAALTSRTNVTTAGGWDTGAATTNIANQTFTITTTSVSCSILVEILRGQLTSDLTGSLSFVGTQPKATRKALASALSFVGTFTKKTILAAKTAALSFVGSLTKRTLKALSGALSFVGTITKIDRRLLTQSGLFFNSVSGYIAEQAGVRSWNTSNVFNDVNGSPYTGQVFIAKESGNLYKAKFFLGVTGSPTGNCTADLWALGAGTFGTDERPTGTPGTPLATSDPIDVTTLFTDASLGAWVTFTFTGANAYALVAGTHYGISASYLAGNSTNCLRISYQPFTVLTDHPGNRMRYSNQISAWSTNSVDTDVAHEFFIYEPLTKRTRKALSAALAFVGSITKRTGKALSAALSFIGNIATVYIPSGGTLFLQFIQGFLFLNEAYASPGTDAQMDELYTSSNDEDGVAFSASVGGFLSSAFFVLNRIGSPTGDIVAKLYSVTGTLDVDAVPDTLLATSSTIDISTLSTDVSRVTFFFDGTYNIVKGTAYCITVYYAGGNAFNKVRLHGDHVYFPDGPGNNLYGDSGVFSPAPWHTFDEGSFAFGVGLTPLTKRTTKYTFGPALGFGVMDRYEFNASFSGLPIYNEINLSSTYANGAGQTFTATSNYITHAKVRLGKGGSPTGNIVAKIYAISGTFGTDSIPTGAALATSSNVDVSTFTTSDTPNWVTFVFPTPYLATGGTNYALTVEYAGGDDDNYLRVAYQGNGIQLQPDPTHPGNASSLSSGVWTGDFGSDVIFAVYSGNSFLKRTLKALSGALSFVGSITRRTYKLLASTLSFVGSLTKRTSRLLTGTLSFVGTLTKSLSRALAGTLSFVGSITKRTGKSLTGTLSFIGSITKRVSTSLTGTLSFVGSITKRAGKSLTSTLSFIGSITKRISKSLTGTLSFIGSLTKITAKALAGTLSFVGALTRRTGKALTAALSFIGSIVKSTSYHLTAACSFIGNASKRCAKSISATLSFVGSLVKSIPRTLSGTISFIGTLSTSETVQMLLSATLAFSGAITRQTAHLMAAVLAFIGTLTKNISVALTASVEFIGALSQSTATTLAATLSFIGSIIKQINSSQSGTLSFVGVLLRQIYATFSAALSFIGTLTKIPTSALSGAISFAGAITKFTSYHLNSFLSFVGDLSRAASGHFFQAMSSTLDFSGNLTRRTSYHLASALSFVGTMLKRMYEAFSATLSFVGSLTTLNVFGRLLTATLSFSGAITRRISKTMSAVLSFVPTSIKDISVALSGTLSVAGALLRMSVLLFSGTVQFVGQVSLVFGKMLTASIGLVGSLTKTVGKLLGGMVSFIGTFTEHLAVHFQLLLTATVSFSGILVRRLGQLIKISLGKIVQAFQIAIEFIPTLFNISLAREQMAISIEISEPNPISISIAVIQEPPVHSIKL